MTVRKGINACSLLLTKVAEDDPQLRDYKLVRTGRVCGGDFGTARESFKMVSDEDELYFHIVYVGSTRSEHYEAMRKKLK